MQKISTYLYPNRIIVIADMAIFPVRWNIVYQNRVKIYQGVDNILTIDVKNADQKRVDISSMTLEMSITDINGVSLATLPLVNSSTLGLATVNITPDILEPLMPQFLNFTIYKIDNNIKTVMYTDTHFGVKGNMELVGSAVSTTVPPRYITRFNMLTNTSTVPFEEIYYSDAVDIVNPNVLYPFINESISFLFETTLLEAVVTLEFTKDSVISSGSEWSEIETISIPENSSSTNRIYSYPTLSRDYKWARVKYKKLSTNGIFNRVTIKFEKNTQVLFTSGTAGEEPTITVDGGWSTL